MWAGRGADLVEGEEGVRGHKDSSEEEAGMKLMSGNSDGSEQNGVLGRVQ